MSERDLAFSENKRSLPDELLSIERRRGEAIAQHDLEFLAQLYADDFQGVTAIGYAVTKARLLEVFQLDDPRVGFTTDELQARVFDQAAVVTGRLTGRTRAGEQISQSRFLHVYVRRAGRWQIVAGQGTPIPPQTSI